MIEEEMILEVKDLTKKFSTSQSKEITACNQVSLKLYKGKTLAVVGGSGCGKSTLAKLIVQAVKPTTGQIFFRGKDITQYRGEEARQVRKHIQMVFQDPLGSFNPKMLVKDIVCEPLRNFGMIHSKDVKTKAIDLLRQVGLPEEFAERYPHSMSGGQRQRVAIARALALNPEVIIFDEATSALDVSIQKSIICLLRKIQKEKNISYLFICHDLVLANQFSDEVAIMYLGHLMEVVKDLEKGCMHPYSNDLLNSVFQINPYSKQEMRLLEGEIPSLIDLPAGCPFQTRCKQQQEICKLEKPKLKQIREHHQLACHLGKKH